MRLPSSTLEDQGLPALAVQRELLAGDLEPLHRRQQVLHPLFLPEQDLGRAARFRPGQFVKAQLRFPHAVSRAVGLAARGTNPDGQPLATAAPTQL